jgi:hypothetical protein
MKMGSPTLFRKKREIGWGTLGFGVGWEKQTYADREPFLKTKYATGPTASAAGPHINP